MYFAFAALVLVRLFLAFKIPVLSDEAYYVFWGTHFDGGYYDLPPMIGWWESLVTRFSLHPFLIRLPNLLVMSLVAGGIYDVMKRYGKTRALWAALIYFALPMQLLAVIISPDIPLIFFSFCAAVLFFFSDQKIIHRFSKTEVWVGRAGYFFAGALWGAAFLSKYFALMLVPGIIAYLFVSRKSMRARLMSLLSLLWVIAGALPFLFQHLYWNSKNCMANFVFNLISRQNASDGSVVQTFGLFVLYLCIVATPVFLFDLFKSPKTNLSEEGRERSVLDFEEEHFFRDFCFLMWAVPISMFGITALLSKGQGIHWYLSYVPFFVMWVSFKYNDKQVMVRAKWVFALSGVLAILASVLVYSPNFIVEHILKGRYRLDIQMGINGEKIAAEIAPAIRNVDAVFSNGYVSSSSLDLLLRRYSVFDPTDSKRSVGMWGSGSRFGRVFDWVSDFRSLQGRSIMVFAASQLPPYEFSDYFFNSHAEKFSINGADYFLMIGQGFKADEYIEKIVVPSINQFYPAFIFQDKCPVREHIL